jgi:hypothetical protein
VVRRDEEAAEAGVGMVDLDVRNCEGRSANYWFFADFEKLDLLQRIWIYLTGLF